MIGRMALRAVGSLARDSRKYPQDVKSWGEIASDGIGRLAIAIWVFVIAGCATGIVVTLHILQAKYGS